MTIIFRMILLSGANIKLSFSMKKYMSIFLCIDICQHISKYICIRVSLSLSIHLYLHIYVYVYTTSPDLDFPRTLQVTINHIQSNVTILSNRCNVRRVLIYFSMILWSWSPKNKALPLVLTGIPEGSKVWVYIPFTTW